AERPGPPAWAIAVVVGALAVLWFVSSDWWRVPDECAWEPDPDSWPAECTIDYTRWLYLIDPNVRYRDDYSLSIDENQLFEACIAAVGSTHDTPVGWLIDAESGRHARDVEVPDRVLDACREYGDFGASELDWIARQQASPTPATPTP
ncbi:MAG: hypothetical protein HYU54_11455, partial [Actinobacteria bacterium]|nr:hypothetical protein [Actinomycetota bacterium]